MAYTLRQIRLKMKSVGKQSFLDDGIQETIKCHLDYLKNEPFLHPQNLVMNKTRNQYNNCLREGI